jgi:hypothetical protein
LLDLGEREQLLQELFEKQRELGERERNLREREAQVERAEAALKLDGAPALPATGPWPTNKDNHDEGDDRSYKSSELLNESHRRIFMNAQPERSEAAVAPAPTDTAGLPGADHRSAMIVAESPDWPSREPFTKPFGVRQKSRALLVFSCIIAALAGAYGLYGFVDSKYGAIDVANRLTGHAQSAEKSVETPVDHVADIQALGPVISACFHPTGVFVRAKFQEAQVATDGATVAGSVQFRGAISEVLYQMTFVLSVRKDGDKVEIKVRPELDTALFPPAAKCELRNWTELND